MKRSVLAILVNSIVMLLLVKSLAAQDILTTRVTGTGLRVSFPQEFISQVDESQMTINLLQFLAEDFIVVRILTADDLVTEAEGRTIASAEDVVTVLQDSGATNFSPIESIVLTNGQALLQSYDIPEGEGLFIVVQVTDGRLALVEGFATASVGIQNYRQMLIDIASSIEFGEPITTSDNDLTSLPELFLPSRPLRLTEMPTGTVVLESDVFFNLPSDPEWSVSDDNEPIGGSVSLVYGDFQAIGVINIDYLDDGSSFNDWRNAMLLIIDEMFVNDQGITPQPEQFISDNGQLIIRFVGSQLVIHLIDLGGNLGGFIMTVINDPTLTGESSFVQTLDSVARSMVRFVRIPSP